MRAARGPRGRPRPGHVIGRDQELDTVLALLDGGDRMVTLTGRAGVGKTLLARALAGQVDHAVFVPLTDVAAPARALGAIAAGCGLSVLPGSQLSDALAHHLRDERLLLVLDTLEHLLEVAPAIAVLLERCPQVTVLATSQASLQLAEERVVAVHPLPLPDPTAGTAALRTEPAVELYCARAQAVDHEFALTDANASVVGDLCRALEGLPLAIELAAARSRVLPAGEFLTRLDAAPLDLLHARRAPALPRHQSLRAAIDWTYRRLDPAAQAMLRSWSVLHGPITVEFAEAQRVEAPAADVSRADTIDCLETLVDFHLLDLEPGSEPVAFVMATSIRSFAQEQLLDHGEHDKAHDRYVSWAAALARALLTEGRQGDDGEARARIAAAQVCLTGAIAAAIDLGRADDALDIAVTLAFRWSMAGYDESHADLLEQVLREVQDVRSGSHARLLASAGLLTSHLSDPSRHAEVVERLELSEELARASGDDEALLHVLEIRAVTLPFTRDLPAAAAALQEGLALAARFGDPRWQVRFELLAASLAHLQVDDERTISLASTALERARSTRFEPAVVAAGTILRPLVARHPYLEDVAPTYDECLSIARRIDLPWYEAAVLPMIAAQDLQQGDLASATGSCIRALRLVRGSRTPTLQGLALVSASEIAAARSDHAVAVAIDASTQQSADVRRATSAPESVARHAAVMQAARGALGEDDAADAVRVGRSLTLDDMIDEALDYLSPFAPTPPLVPAPRQEQAPGENLTPRQREVLGLIASGLPNKEIAAMLGISPKTAMHHCAAIYVALGVRGRTEATVWAARHGLLETLVEER